MNTRFPGSTHDAAIWQAANVRVTMENLYTTGNNNYVLLGDSSYQLQPSIVHLKIIENSPESNYEQGIS